MTLLEVPVSLTAKPARSHEGIGPRGPELLTYIEEYRRRAGIGTTRPPGRVLGEEGVASPDDGRTETEEDS